MHGCGGGFFGLGCTRTDDGFKCELVISLRREHNERIWKENSLAC